MTTTDLFLRDGVAADLRETFTLSELAVHDAASRSGILAGSGEPTEVEIARSWRRRRGLIEFMAAQPGGSYRICEDAGAPIGYGRVVRFEGVEELTELMVKPGHQGRGVGRTLLEDLWPRGSEPESERLVIAAGAAADLSLYTGFGVMPVAGHWHMRADTARYLELRAAEPDEIRAGAAHVLEPDHAIREWNRLEPEAIGHRRPALHEFLARDRSCLACIDERTETASALCWVSAEGEIGPAVGAWPGDLVPVVVAALDRVARIQEPELLSVFTTTVAWALLNRLRGLGFRVWWPSWILCSRPLPGLDRYAPTRPPHLI